jgi:hypothetical protein
VFDFAHFGGPGPVGRAADEAGADRVHADVLERVVPVLLVADHPGGEALGEERPGAFGRAPSAARAPQRRFAGRVVLAGVGAVRAVERFGDVLDAARDEGVIVRVEEAVGVDRDRVTARGRREQRDEEKTVGVGLEEHRLEHGAGGDVEEAVRKARAENAGHDLHGTALETQRNPPCHFRHTSGTPSRAATGVRHQTSPREPRPGSSTSRGRRRQWTPAVAGGVSGSSAEAFE